MTQSPKEKAHELVDNYWLMDKINPSLSKEQAKQCALIAVDEILNINSVDKDFSLSHYWLDVKDEILNL
jgi:hypothetical protein